MCTVISRNAYKLRELIKSTKTAIRIRAHKKAQPTWFQLNSQVEFLLFVIVSRISLLRTSMDDNTSGLQAGKFGGCRTGKLECKIISAFRGSESPKSGCVPVFAVFTPVSLYAQLIALFGIVCCVQSLRFSSCMYVSHFHVNGTHTFRSFVEMFPRARISFTVLMVYLWLTRIHRLSVSFLRCPQNFMGELFFTRVFNHLQWFYFAYLVTGNWNDSMQTFIIREIRPKKRGGKNNNVILKDLSATVCDWCDRAN